MSSPETQSKGKLAAAIDAFAKLAVTLGLICGGAWTAWQYAEAKSDQKIQRTVEYIARFEDGSAAAAFRHINTVMRAHLEQFSELEVEGITLEDRKALILALADEEVSGVTIADDLDAISQFYEGLHACVQGGLCDATSANRYFSQRAQQVIANFEPYVRVRRQNNPGYASELEAFAKGTTVAPE